MSLGSDPLRLHMQLAWATVKAARGALGEHGNLTIRVSCVHNALSFFQSELLECPPGWFRWDSTGVDEAAELDRFVFSCLKELHHVVILLYKLPLLSGLQK